MIFSREREKSFILNTKGKINKNIEYFKKINFHLPKSSYLNSFSVPSSLMISFSVSRLALVALEKAQNINGNLVGLIRMVFSILSPLLQIS